MKSNDIANEYRVVDLWKTQQCAAVLMLLLYPLRRILLRKLARNVLEKKQFISCQVRSLSNVIREQGVQRIDLLKMGIEGAALGVLAGVADEHRSVIRQIAGRCLRGQPSPRHALSSPAVVRLLANRYGEHASRQ